MNGIRRLLTAGVGESFYEHYAEANEQNVVEFLSFSASNPSSIKNCIEAARLNSRSVRNRADQRDVGHHQLGPGSNCRRLWAKGTSSREDLAKFLRFVQEDLAAVRRPPLTAPCCATMPTGFSRLGRASRARPTTPPAILDVKYHVLLPEEEHVGGPLDYYQWTSILRSVSALTAYHWVYRETAETLADRGPPDPQRHPAAVAGKLLRQTWCAISTRSASPMAARAPPSATPAASRNRLEHSHMDDIFQHGVHEFIQEFLADNARLGEIITRQYLI